MTPFWRGRAGLSDAFCLIIFPFSESRIMSDCKRIYKTPLVPAIFVFALKKTIDIIMARVQVYLSLLMFEWLNMVRLPLNKSCLDKVNQMDFASGFWSPQIPSTFDSSKWCRKTEGVCLFTVSGFDWRRLSGFVFGYWDHNEFFLSPGITDVNM